MIGQYEQPGKQSPTIVLELVCGLGNDIRAALKEKRDSVGKAVSVDALHSTRTDSAQDSTAQELTQHKTAQHKD